MEDGKIVKEMKAVVEWFVSGLSSDDKCFNDKTDKLQSEEVKRHR